MIHPAPKPDPRPIAPRRFSSIPSKSHTENLEAKRKLQAKQKPLPRVNRKRQAKESPRKYGPKERRDWMTSLPCLGCGVLGYSQQAHVISGGKGRKSDADKTVPLCGPRDEYGQWRVVGVMFVAPRKRIAGCHHEFDNAKQSWPAERGLDMLAEAARYEAEFQAFVGAGGR